VFNISAVAKKKTKDKKVNSFNFGSEKIRYFNLY
jgi:hypothetical protein